MGGDDGRLACVLQFAQDLRDNFAGCGVDGIQWLIQQQQVGILGQRARQQGALLLPARQLADLPFSQIAQFHAGDGLVGGGPIGLARLAQPTQMDIPAGQDQLAQTHRELPIEVAALGQVGHALAGFLDRRAKQPNGAVRQRQQPGSGFEQGRFARPIGANERDPRAPLHTERYIV